MTELLKLLDELGDAHEAYADAASLEEAQALEDRCKELRQSILSLVETDRPTQGALEGAELLRSLRQPTEVRAQALREVWDIARAPTDKASYGDAGTLFKLGHQQARLEIRDAILALLDAPSPERAAPTQAQIAAVLDAIADNEAAINAVDVLACELAQRHNVDGEQCWKAGIAAVRAELCAGKPECER